MDQVDITDITDTGLLHAPGEEDRVFRLKAAASEMSPDGVYVVKVKSWCDLAAAPIGRADVHMTASLCDETGRAQRIGDRVAVYGQPHVHTIQGAAVNVAANIQASMRLCATNMLAAVISTAVVHSVPGIGRRQKENDQ